ncbi:RNase H domain-containing protein [Trichonephila clavipes]|nr:RNase H domain-containing protein [Trichonephila clavipes]
MHPRNSHMVAGWGGPKIEWQQVCMVSQSCGTSGLGPKPDFAGANIPRYATASRGFTTIQIFNVQRSGYSFNIPSLGILTQPFIASGPGVVLKSDAPKHSNIVFCWLPSHVGIIGNEQADNAAKSATTHLPLAVPLSDMKRVIMHHISNLWQESWSQQLDNKLHSVKPVIGAWPVMPMRRTDVKLTRLRIGHTRFTHRHLLFGERAPEYEESKGEEELLHKTEVNHYKQDLQDIIGLGDGQKKSSAKMRRRQGEMPEVEDSCECSIPGVGPSAFQLTSTWNTPRSVRIVTPAFS